MLRGAMKWLVVIFVVCEIALAMAVYMMYLHNTIAVLTHNPLKSGIA